MWGDVHLGTVFFKFRPVLGSPVRFDVLGEAPGEENFVEGLRDLVSPGSFPELLDPWVASEDIQNDEVVTSIDLEQVSRNKIQRLTGLVALIRLLLPLPGG